MTVVQARQLAVIQVDRHAEPQHLVLRNQFFPDVLDELVIVVVNGFDDPGVLRCVIRSEVGYEDS